MFSSNLVHLTTAATPSYAPDISGVFTTTLQIAGTIGVAAFGTLYLGQIAAHSAGHALGVVTAAFASRRARRCRHRVSSHARAIIRATWTATASTWPGRSPR